MSEPSSSVPGEMADAQVEEPQSGTDEVEKVELNLDEDKLEAWDDVKGDYQIDPDAESAPDTDDEDDGSSDESPEAEADATTS
jgi:hypothetical protein